MADAIRFEYPSGATLYVRVYTSSSTAVASALTAGTSGNVRLYFVSDAALVSAGMTSTAGLYAYSIFIGSPSTTAADQSVGSGMLRWGGTAAVDPLPLAPAEAAGGLFTRGSGAGQINQSANGMADANVVRNAGTAIVAASGRQEVNVTHYGGTAGTFASGVPTTNPRCRPNVWYVDDDASDANDGKTVATAKATIAAALTACSDGDTIMIMPGEYPENVSIGKRGITLMGLEREACVIEPATGKAISVARANTTIKNLTVNGTTPTSPGLTDGVGIYCFSHDGLVVENCIINGDYDGLDCNGSDNPVILGSVITGKYDGANLANCRNVRAEHTTFISTANFSGADSGFRAAHATGLSDDPTVEHNSGRFVDCDFIITRTTAGSNAIAALELAGNWSVVGCKLAAKATHASFSANVYGLRETFSTPKLCAVHVEGCSITTSTAGAGTAYDIHNAVTGSRHQLASATYDSAKASGTIYELLQPTTLGTRLDINSGGGAGIDLGNVENPTATVNLTGLTIKDAADLPTAAENAAAAWASAARTLTAGTNIVLAKGTGVTGFNDLDAAGVRTAVGLAAANLDTQLDGLEPGTSQPRINRKPDPGFTIQVSRRADGTYKCTKPIRLTAGAVDAVFAFIDMSPLFGAENFAQTVGTPVVSAGGSLTASATGPRDTYAIVEIDGTATAGEERTVTVPVTMTSGTTINVVFDVEVFE